MRKSLAFTLGEVLIALGVIGVVAALIIPMLINGHKAGVARAQFDTAYSIVSKAIADMDADNVSIEPSSYMAVRTFYDKYKQYNKIAVDCGFGSNVNDSVCVKSQDETSVYRAFSGRSIDSLESSLFDDGCIVLTNGMMFCVENPKDNVYGLLITVDVNGKNKNPNRLGYDLFSFELVPGVGVLPVGAPGTGVYGAQSLGLWGKDEATAKTYCDESKSQSWSGITCAYEAAMDKEYFKKLYHGH